MLEHIRKEIFPKGDCNKLKLNKIGPCRIQRKFSPNAYQLDLLVDIGISLIFNFVDMYLYKVDIVETLYNIEKKTKT